MAASTGSGESRDVHRPEDVVTEARSAGPFFDVGCTKLLVMSIFTFGIYEFYWHYKQWVAFKRRSGQPIWPIARTVFAGITFFRLVKEIRDASVSAGLRGPVGGGLLGFSYLLLGIGAWRLPEPHCFLAGLAAVVPLLSAQRAINRLGAALGTIDRPNAWLSVLNIVSILVVWLLLGVIGVLFFPAEGSPVE